MSVPLRFFYNDGDSVVVPETLPFVGLYIPIMDLPGMNDYELSISESLNRKEGKTVFSIVQKIHTYLSVNTSVLSLRTTISNPSFASPSLINLTYSMVVDFLTNVAMGTNTMIPVPDRGSFNGVGEASLRNIFPNCFKVTSVSNIADASGIGAAGAGVLVSTDDLAFYGFFNDSPGSNITTLNITADNRYAIASFFLSLCDGNVAVRSNSSASGITSVTVSRASFVDIPATFTANQNPTTGINSQNLDHLSLTRRTYSISFELSLEPEVLEINTVTSS